MPEGSQLGEYLQRMARRHPHALAMARVASAPVTNSVVRSGLVVVLRCSFSGLVSKMRPLRRSARPTANRLLAFAALRQSAKVFTFEVTQGDQKDSRYLQKKKDSYQP